MGEYLPDEVDAEESSSKQEEETISNTVKSVEITISKPTGPSERRPDEDADTEDDERGKETELGEGSGAGHNGGSGGGNHSGDGDGYGDGKGSHNDQTRKSPVSITPLKVRVVCLNKDRGEYSVTYVPAISAVDGYIDLFMSAETHNYTAAITQVIGIGQPDISFKNNRIKNIVFEEKKPVRLRVVIDYHDYCSMEVRAYGNKI